MKLKASSFALILSVLVIAMPAAAGYAQKDIIDTAVVAGTFNTLATALQAAGLADTLKGKGSFAVGENVSALSLLHFRAELSVP
jgi:hypothetical protein